MFVVTCYYSQDNGDDALASPRSRSRFKMFKWSSKK